MRLGIIGWRGMVGSVLLERMQTMNDFDHVDKVRFFSSTHSNHNTPAVSNAEKDIIHAHDIDALSDCHILISCQGGEYTEKIYPILQQRKWPGYWIDAASTLRLSDDSLIVLDPVNHVQIYESLARGIKTFVGGNCTVSLLLMALKGMIDLKLIDHIHSMTYQAISGAGAKSLEELIKQIHGMGKKIDGALSTGSKALQLEYLMTEFQRTGQLPADSTGGYPLAGNLLPWIDQAWDFGQTKEEWKGHIEAQRILPKKQHFNLDGLCVRVGVLRSHSQALTIQLKEHIPILELEEILAKSHKWIKIVPNDADTTRRELTPLAVSNTLDIAIGRLRYCVHDPRILYAFTTGDQLLWGAAEPLRRMFRIIAQLD